MVTAHSIHLTTVTMDTSITLHRSPVVTSPTRPATYAKAPAVIFYNVAIITGYTYRHIGLSYILNA